VPRLAAIVLAFTALAAAGCLGHGSAQPLQQPVPTSHGPQIRYGLIGERRPLGARRWTLGNIVHEHGIASCTTHLTPSTKALCAAIAYYLAHRPQPPCQSIDARGGYERRVEIAGIGLRQHVIIEGLCKPSTQLAEAVFVISRAAGIRQ
jgi:hypothetical protein